MVIAAYGDTCVDVWKVTAVTTYDPATNDNVTSLRYEHVTQFYIHDQYWFGELTVDGDPTGLFVNTSRPSTVISGVSCGNVPLDTEFCDHMAEVVPGVSELGRTHIVPPIGGRSVNVGYIVRVVPTKLNTMVTWTSSDKNGAAGGPTKVQPGSFLEIDSILTSAAMMIQCSEPCVVMQYNKGKSWCPGER
jgi:IgGFc binding protein